MPARADAKQDSATAPAASAAASPPSAGFAQALRMLQTLAGDGAPAGDKPGQAKLRAPGGDPARPAEDGKDLPLTALLLPLVLPLQAQPADAASAAAGSGGGAAAVASDAGGGQRTSLAELRDVLQLLGGAQAGAATTVEFGSGPLSTALANLAAAPAHGSGVGAAAPATALAGVAPAIHGGAQTPPPSNAAPSPPSAAAPLTVADPAFADALGERVAWLTGHGGQAAQVHLHPRELGPLQVHVRVDGHHTEVLFQTQHAGLKDVLEAAVPRLREMLAQGGQQVSVNVQQHAGGWQGQSGQGGHPGTWGGSSPAWTHAAAVGDEAPDGASPLSRWYGLATGVIDTYV